ncbi:MAG: DNA-deoxyinosine glycosylase [Clostridiales bacterium]|nr:MAG: DNA-deoxyinosine glycosylase [Clostridiales bacterium]
MNAQQVIHPLAPVFDERSRVLILGTMPSPKSRETGFYYGHPQNRFWRVMAELLDEPFPASREERLALALRRHFALWDVLASCVIRGADDGSIREPEANDLSAVLSAAPIEAIFTTGTKAAALYRKLCLPKTGMEAIALPSTSAANCRFYSYEQLVKAYAAVKEYLN